MASATRAVETVVVGAGQAGLIVSALLGEAGREHVVLDRRHELGGGWLDRWDDFRLVSPNWTVSVPRFAYRGDEPDGFMPRDEIVDHFRAYAAAIDAPVELDTDVTRLRPMDGRSTRGARFVLSTSRGELEARNVVVAGGPFQVPHVPELAESFDRSIHQLHSHDYRRPHDLPPGGVLLVGSGQTGVQLAEELSLVGREVTISVGHCGRAPRTYRGRDVFWWFRQLGTRGREVGTPLPSPASMPDARARLACNPHLSGHGGGHDTNLRQMAANGIRLVGRFEAAEGTRARFGADLSANLRFADAFFLERFGALCQRFIDATGIEVTDEPVAQFDFEPPEVTELDLAAEGISTVIWTSGYRPAFAWIEAPVLDGFGLPIADGGLTSTPGLAFIGTPWLVDMGSANLIGLVRDAEALVARLVEPVAA
jgi:putative flavoprotein involved in K+ transport